MLPLQLSRKSAEIGEKEGIRCEVGQVISKEEGMRLDSWAHGIHYIVLKMELGKIGIHN